MAYCAISLLILSGQLTKSLPGHTHLEKINTGKDGKLRRVNHLKRRGTTLGWYRICEYPWTVVRPTRVGGLPSET